MGTNRRNFLKLSAAAPFGIGTLSSDVQARPTQVSKAPPAVAQDVKREFRRAWDAYKEIAFGHDLLKPVSGTSTEFFIDDEPLGLTIIESLDTLYFMELDNELEVAVDWIENNLNFDVDGYVSIFEANIRLVGGLLSGYKVTGNEILLNHARDLADRLLPAFEKSPSGMPYAAVNLKTGEVRGPVNFLAEIGTIIAEFGELSRLVGDDTYYNVAKDALQTVYENRSDLDLVGAAINVETETWENDVARVGPPVDSLYEYLWDGWALFGDSDLLRWFSVLTDGVLDHQAERYNDQLWFKHVDFRTGELVAREQSELAIFYAGLLGEAGQFDLAREYHDSWTAVIEKYDLPPGSIDYSDLSALSTGYFLRPEYVDSAFILYTKTGQEVYRDRTRMLYENMKQHCRVENGYTIITDLTTRPMTKGDLTSGYWWSENMKYFYLAFADSPRFNYDDYYLTTEANVLRGVQEPKQGQGRGQSHR